jgi:hypothetical protein
MTSICSFRQAPGMAAIATLTVADRRPRRGPPIKEGAASWMKQDLADREKDIHWSEGFDPSVADLFSHNALLINASCERICGPLSTRRSGRSGQTNSCLRPCTRKFLPIMIIPSVLSAAFSSDPASSMSFAGLLQDASCITHAGVDLPTLRGRSLDVGQNTDRHRMAWDGMRG